MSLTQKNQLLIAYKKLVGKSHTNSTFSDAGEALGSGVQIDNSTIFASEIPSSPNTTLNSITDNIVEKVEFSLESITLSQYQAVGTSAGGITADGDGAPLGTFSSGFHAFKLKLSSNYETVSANPKKGTGVFINNSILGDSNGALQIVPSKYGASYAPEVSSSSGIINTLDQEDYYLDTYSGVLFVQDINRVPTKVTAYLYIGQYQKDVVTNPAGSTGYLQYNNNGAFGASSNLFWDISNNRLGIGTTSPDNTFHVHKGSAGTVTGASSTNVLVLENSTSNFLKFNTPDNSFAGLNFGFPGTGETVNIGSIMYGGPTAAINPGGMRFLVGGIDRVVINSAGNVGIGNTSPGELLDVRTATATAGQGARIGEAKIGTWEGNPIFAAFTHNSVHSTTNSYALLQNNVGATYLNAASGEPIYFRINNENQMILNSAGNVGIGTTSPGSKLTINAGFEGQPSPFTALEILGPNQPGNANSAQNIRWSFQSAGGSFIRSYRGTSWDTYLEFATNFISQGSDSPQVRMLISHDGNVGIGTTSPGTKLEVAGAIRGGSFNVGTTNTSEAWFGRGGDRTLGTFTLQLGGSSATNTGFEIVDRAWSKRMLFVSGEAPEASLIVDSAGNVGINRADPSYKLDVNGQVRATSGFVGNLTGNADTATTATNTINPTFSGDSVEVANITNRVDSGFYQYYPASVALGWPVDTFNWQHLLSTTHSNDGNYYAMQLAAPFYNQEWYLRNTAGSGTTGWKRVVVADGNTYNINAATATTLPVLGAYSTPQEPTGTRTSLSTGVYSYNVYNSSLGDGTPTQYWSLLNFGNGTSGQAQLAASWTSSGVELYFRSLRDVADNWWTWKEILHSANYNSYSPTLTGGGASGIWSINITGNAATVTNGVYTNTISSHATTGVVAGNGLTGGGTVGSLTLNVGAGSGISVAADTVAVDTTVVRTTGDQTIAGIKTFSSTIAGSITGNAATATTATSVSNTLTRGTYLTGNNYNGSAATTWAVDATSANTALTVVSRDSVGRFSAGGIYIGGTGTANLLDDYEEGTFTPTIFGSTTAGINSFSSRAGNYTKIGRIVFFSIRYTISSWTSNPSGNFTIGGLPFTSRSITGQWNVNIANYNGPFSTSTLLDTTQETTGIIYGNSNNILIAKYQASGAAVTNIYYLITNASIGEYSVSGVYETA